MKVPFNWLREYIDIYLTPEELAERLTMAGIEVAELKIFAPLSDKIVAGKIKNIFHHPEANNLQVVEVESGEGLVQVVCGAWNIKEGDLAPLALPGAYLPDGTEIKNAEIKRINSAGMLCSGIELGLDLAEEEPGILILDEGYTPGSSLKESNFIHEPVLELDLTPNRGDCLGLIGVAREVSALTGEGVKLPSSAVKESTREIEQLSSVEIAEPYLCPRYTARMLEGITIGFSPLQIQLKLLSAGLRPINNIVDVTNYIMWETGHPTHSFDYDCLQGGRIIVRRACAGEEMLTLDGVNRMLDPEMLVIADEKVPIGLAGVMGGEYTEITETTTRILLEAACFSPANIRRTARRLNLPSEASQRFEKGVDTESALFVQNRAVRLMQELAGGEICRGILDVYPFPPSKRKVELRSQRLKEYLGYCVTKEETKNILHGIGSEIDDSQVDNTFNGNKCTDKDSFSFAVEIPSYRPDLELEVDLIEEIARIKGYDKIPSTLPQGIMTSGRPSVEKRILARFRETLTACGLQEVINFSFLNPKLFDDLGLGNEDLRRDAVKIQNPLSEEQAVLRTTLLPSLLQVLQYNFNRQMHNVHIFEIGKVFLSALKGDKLPREKTNLALAVSGYMDEHHWQSPPQKIDFFYLKGILDTIMISLGIENCMWRGEEIPLLHPSRGATLVLNEKEIGFAGQLHPSLQEKYEFKQVIYLAELDLEYLINNISLLQSFKPLPKYPSVLRDLAFVVPEQVTAAEIFATLKKCGGELLEDLSLFDVYKGKQIPESCMSMAFALTFRHPERTLQDDEVDRLQKTMENELYEKYSAVLRQI